MTVRRPWWVSTTDAEERHFATFERAERWARRKVADSARDEYSIRADIHGPECRAEVRLDGCDRVWTDFVERLP